MKPHLTIQIPPKDIESSTDTEPMTPFSHKIIQKFYFLISQSFLASQLKNLKNSNFKIYLKSLLGFLIGTCTSLVAISLLKYYSPLIATLAGGGIGAIFLGLASVIFVIDIKPEASDSLSANQSEDNNIDFFSWLYPKEIEPKLRKTYFILVGLLVICFCAALILHSNNSLIEDFSINMATEILGILLVLFAVDRVIESERDKKDKKKERVAMQQIKQPLLHHFYVLQETFEKVKLDHQTSKIKEISEIFDKLDTEQVSQLSESIKSTDNLLYSLEDMNWLDYLSQECHSTKETLNRTVEKYSLFLQPSLLRSIEEFINSAFIRLIVDYHEKFKHLDESEHILQNQEELFENPDFILLLKQHLFKYFKLIKLFNKNTGEQEKNILFK
ncbi:DUF1097 domain-containing protein [Gloeothece verrucosa]|nr:DUF1097 domain-containing protein [Gloeothece verrucosa]